MEGCTEFVTCFVLVFCEVNSHQSMSSSPIGCAHALRISVVLNTYYNDLEVAASAYNCAVKDIMQLKRDRKREWVANVRWNCMINRPLTTTVSQSSRRRLATTWKFRRIR